MPKRGEEEAVKDQTSTKLNAMDSGGIQNEMNSRCVFKVSVIKLIVMAFKCHKLFLGMTSVIQKQIFLLSSMATMPYTLQAKPAC